MSNIINNLKAWGCDIDGAMERFMDDEELYITCLDSVINDKNFDNLGKALEEQNVKAAFECAHTLKGVLANMGLTPLYDVVINIVEPLRNEQISDCTAGYKKLLEVKKQLEELVEH